MTRLGQATRLTARDAAALLDVNDPAVRRVVGAAERLWVAGPAVLLGVVWTDSAGALLGGVRYDPPFELPAGAEASIALGEPPVGGGAI